MELEGSSGTLKVPQYKEQYFSFPRDINYSDKYFLAGVELGRTSWRELFRGNLYGSLFLVNGFDIDQTQERAGGGSIRFDLGVVQGNEVVIAFYKKYKNSIHHRIV